MPDTLRKHRQGLGRVENQVSVFDFFFCGHLRLQDFERIHPIKMIASQQPIDLRFFIARGEPDAVKVLIALGFNE